MSADVIFPVKPGDWVQQRGNPAEVAVVKNVHEGGAPGEFWVDLWLYTRDGDREGRRSPACGGPRTFEPCCEWESWERIEEPRFPIALKWVPDGNGKSTAGYHSGAKVLPPREWRRPERRRKAAPKPAPAARTSDYDPQLEAHARRMAAQELRDMLRNLTPEALRKRAEELETEAEAISPRS